MSQQLDEFLQQNTIDYENSLKVKETRKLFRQFLQTEFNTEHIDFLDAVEYYHNCVLQFYNSLNGSTPEKKENSKSSVFGSVICDVLELKDAEAPQIQTQVKKKKSFAISPSALVEEMEEDNNEIIKRKSVGSVKADPTTPINISGSLKLDKQSAEALRKHVTSNPISFEKSGTSPKNGKENLISPNKQEDYLEIRQVEDTAALQEDEPKNNETSSTDKKHNLEEHLKDEEELEDKNDDDDQDEDDEDDSRFARIRKTKSVGPSSQLSVMPRKKGSTPVFFSSNFRSDGLHNLINNLHNNRQLFRRNDEGDDVPEFEALADEIIEDYIVEDAIKQINISFELKCQIQDLRDKLKQMDLKEKKEQQYHLFSKAEDLVTFELHDNFTRFLRSPQLRKFLLSNLKNEDLMSKITRPVGKSSIYYSVDEFFDPTIKNRDFDFVHQLNDDSPDWNIMFEDKNTCLFFSRKCYLIESGTKQFMMDQKQLLQNLVTTKLVYTLPAHFEVAFALKSSTLPEEKIVKMQVHGNQPTKINPSSGKNYSCTTILREMEMSFPFSNREFVNIVTAKKFEATDKIPERIVVIAKPTDDSQIPKFNSKNERAVLYYSQTFYKISDNTTRVIQCKMINVGGSATNISKPLVKKMLKTNAEKERKILHESVLQILPSLTFGVADIPTRTRSGKSMSEMKNEISLESVGEDNKVKVQAREAHRHQVLQDLNTCKLFDAYLENQKSSVTNHVTVSNSEDDS